MSEELQQLRAKVAELKAAPIFSKAAIAEQVMDKLIALVERQDAQIAWVHKRVNFLMDDMTEEQRKNG